MSSNYYGDAVTAETLLSDLTFLVMAFAVVTMFLLAGIVSKRVDRHRILTTSTGFVSYFLFFGIYGLVNLLRFKYFYDARLTCTIIGVLFYSAGLLSYTIFAELDQREYRRLFHHESVSALSSFKFTILGGAALVACVALMPDMAVFWFPFYGIVAAFTLASVQATRKYFTLEMIQDSGAIPRFIFGLALSGSSNAFQAFEEVIGPWALILNNVLVVIGGALMVAGWAKFPSTRDLEWLFNVDRVLVITKGSAIPVVDYKFQARLRAGNEDGNEVGSGVGTGDGKGSRDAKHSKDHRDTLTGSALSGVISLMKEILASDASLQEIDHGDEKLYFAYGNYTIAVVFAKTETPEVTYRLQKFHVEFENEYRAVLEDWQGNLREFDGVPSLLQRTFAA